MIETIKHVPVTIIKKYGYEYYLVEVERKDNRIPQPCFMGHIGMALHSCKKVSNENIFNKKQKKSRKKLYNRINKDRK